VPWYILSPPHLACGYDLFATSEKLSIASVRREKRIRTIPWRFWANPATKIVRQTSILMNIPGHSTRNGYFLHREIYMRLVLRTNSLCIAMSRAPFTAAASPSGLPGITGNVLNGYAVLIGGST